MEFWFSGEVDNRIADAFRAARSRVEPRCNACCRDHDYGDAITKIAIIPMVLGPKFLNGRRERRLWQRKTRSADYRTIIDFEAFRSADDSGRDRLLVMNVVDAVRHLQTKAGKHFRADDPIADILEEFGLSANPATQ